MIVHLSYQTALALITLPVGGQIHVPLPVNWAKCSRYTSCFVIFDYFLILQNTYLHFGLFPMGYWGTLILCSMGAQACLNIHLSPNTKARYSAHLSKKEVLAHVPQVHGSRDATLCSDEKTSLVLQTKTARSRLSLEFTYILRRSYVVPH